MPLFLWVALTLRLMGVVLAIRHHHHRPRPRPRYDSSVISNSSSSSRPLLLLSFDGFRYDFLDFVNTPHHHYVAQDGVRAVNGFYPVFPTTTTPNYFSMATGLYSESHGVVDNHVFGCDPPHKKVTNPEKMYGNWSAEPIWITARKHGLKTALWGGWPASRVSFNGKTADYVEPKRSNLTRDGRVLCAIDQIATLNFSFVAVYFEFPDLPVGHLHGPFSEEVEASVVEADRLVGVAVERLREAGLYDRVNLVIASDHGLAPFVRNATYLLHLGDAIDFGDTVAVKFLEPSARVAPKPRHRDKVYRQLKAWHPHVRAYYKEETPEHMHYRRNCRILPIVVVPDVGYFVSTRGHMTRDGRVAGVHGYDNLEPSMRPVFVARGPGFVQGGQVVEPFEIVDIYPMMCRLLGIPARPNNGSLARVETMLRKLK